MNTLNHVTLGGVTKYVKDSAGQAMLAPEELTLIAANAYAVGDLFRYDGKLYKASAAIEVGDTIEVGTNCEETTIAGESIKDVQVNGVSVVTNGVANVPIGSNNTIGAVKAGGAYYGIQVSSAVPGMLFLESASTQDLKSGANIYKPVVPSNQYISTFYGLAKAAGADMSSSSNAIGNYTDAAKTAIKNMIGVEEGLKVVRLI